MEREIQAIEAKGIIHNPFVVPSEVHPRKPSLQGRRRGHKKHRLKRGKKKTVAGAEEEKAERKLSKQEVPSRPSALLPAPAAYMAPRVLTEESRALSKLAYSARLHLMIEMKGLRGHEWEDLLTACKEDAIKTLKEMAAKAEHEREMREHKGLLARLDYHDQVDFKKNFVPFTAKEISKTDVFASIFKRMMIMPSLPVVEGEEPEVTAARLVAAQMQLENDQQTMVESLIKAFDAMEADRKAGVQHAACVVTAFFRGIFVRSKVDKIWTAAEKLAIKQVIEEEEQRVADLKANFSATEWIRVEILRVERYSAWVKITTPIWSFMVVKSRGPNLIFRIRIKGSEVFIDCGMGERPKDPACERMQVMEIGPLKPETSYKVTLRIQQVVVDGLMGSLQDNDADDIMQLTYMLTSLTDNDIALHFKTKAALEVPQPPGEVTAAIARRFTPVSVAKRDNNAKEKENELRVVAAPQLHYNWAKVVGLRQSTGQAIKKEPSQDDVYQSPHVTLIEVTWTCSNNNNENDNAIDEFYVQRCLRHPDQKAPLHHDDWVYCYRGPNTGCVDMLREEEVRNYYSALRTRQGVEVGPSTPEVNLVYRVMAHNQFGWSRFSTAVGVVTVPCGDVILEEDKEDPHDLKLDPNEFPHHIFGLPPDVLDKPEHFERSMALPNISRKYKPRLGKQLPALSAGGQVWHAYLPVDAAAIARRRERVMRYRAMMAALGERDT